MPLENKKLSSYANLASGNIDSTTKIVALTGQSPANVNIPLANFVEDSLSSDSTLKPLSAKKGKYIMNQLDTRVPTGGIEDTGKILTSMDDGSTQWVLPADNLTTGPGEQTRTLNANQGRILNEKIEDRVPSTNGVYGQVLIGSDNNANNWTTPNKSLVGLGNVDNTSDLNKPISIAVANVLTDYLRQRNPSAVGSFTVASDYDYTLAEITE